MNMDEYKRRIDDAHTVTGVPSYWQELQEVTRERDELREMLASTASDYDDLVKRMNDLVVQFRELQNRADELYRQSEYWQNISSRWNPYCIRVLQVQKQIQIQ